MPKTLQQLMNEVMAMDSQQNVNNTAVDQAVINALNEAQDSLYEDQPWWWATTTATITASSSGLLVLPEETCFVMGVYDSEDTPLNPRVRQDQVDWKKRIISRGVKTYAQEGYDSTTGFPVLHTLPEASGDYTVRYVAYPDEFAIGGESETILGPRSVYHYLKWKAHHIRLYTNEERINLRQEATAMFNKYLKELKGRNRMFLSAHENYISVARG